jgi:hypothetical protein
MQIDIGYRYFPSAVGFHLERAIAAIGADVSYVGLASYGRMGFGESDAVPDSEAACFLWIDPAGRYFPRNIENLNALTACYLVDAHLGHWREQAARFFDVVFLAQKRYVEPFRQMLGHAQVFWLPLAADEQSHRDHQNERIYDIGFVGNIDRAHRSTPRARRLALLREHFTLNPTVTGLSPAEVGHVYSQCKIVFNTSIAGDATMRLFEGAACGAAVLTDAIATENGPDNLFRDGELAFYADDATLLEQARRLLTDDAARERIARAGQARVLGQHLYRHRAEQILQTLSDPALKQSAPMRSASTEQRCAARIKVYTHLHMLDAIFDETRGQNPVSRVWQALPCLARRTLI